MKTKVNAVKEQNTDATLTTQPETPVSNPKTAHPSHKNAAAKHAFGIRTEACLYEMTSTLVPSEALQLIEKLIGTCARRRCWSLISDRKTYGQTPTLDPSLIVYWQLLLVEVFLSDPHDDRPDHGSVALHAISMIETIDSGVRSGEEVNDSMMEVIEEMVCFFIFNLLMMTPSEVVTDYWQRLMTYTRNRYGTILFGAVLRGLKEGTRRYGLSRPRLFYLITELIPMTDDSIRGQIFKAVWSNVVRTETCDGVSWAKLLSPVVSLQDNPATNNIADDVSNVCSRAVARICAFASATCEAIRILHQLEIPIVDNGIVINYKLETCALICIEVQISSRDPSFYGKKFVEQYRLFKAHARQIRDTLNGWAREHSISSFTLIVSSGSIQSKRFHICGLAD